MLKFISALFLDAAYRMEYQTCPLAVGKRSTTFDEDAKLNRTEHQMKAAAAAAAKKNNKTIEIQ